jgi:penicillin amidase
MAPYPGPAQNMIVADREGNLAIRSTGLYPIRPDNGDGLVVRDGSTSASDWLGYWPLEDYPASVNPAQGFLASANQQPLDPSLGRPYLGANWTAPWRAMRINQLLAADSQVTPDAMRRYHTDPGNAKADLFVPAFVEAARGENDLDEARRLLEEWDRRYTKENERAILFELALNELDFRTFDELFLPDGRRLARRPSRSVLAGLLNTPDSPWWDDRRTSDLVETRDDVLAASLEAALELATERYGDHDDGGWLWSAVRHSNVSHLLGLPALSRHGLPVQGGPGNLNPSSGNGSHGASWRMVVEMGPEVRAWATYPGGQSGNPASPRYADRIDQWVTGELDDVLFPHDRADLADDDVIGVLTLRNGAR